MSTILPPRLQSFFIAFKAHVNPFLDIRGRVTLPHHLTLAHIGLTPCSLLQRHIPTIPLFSHKVAPCLLATALNYLPSNKPRAAALTFSSIDPLLTYRKSLVDWLSSKDISFDQRPFFPHVTLCRRPYETGSLSSIAFPLPVPLSSIAVFSGAENGEYPIIAQQELYPAFAVVDHTADIAFDIYAEDLQSLYRHAFFCLCWTSPLFYSLQEAFAPSSLEEIIKKLNELIALADMSFGSCCKAVSYHGNIEQLPSNILHWRMIIDV
jgi:2'-5' RNA ligase